MTKRTAPKGLIEMPRLLPNEEDELAELAKATGRSEGELAHEAIAEYLAAQRWQIDAIKTGIDEADAGLVVSDEDVQSWIDSLGTEQEIPLPRAPRSA